MTLTAADLKRIHDNAVAATACLFMVAIHAIMANGTAIIVYAMPWQCLDTADALRCAGAVDLAIWPGHVGAIHWHWRKPGKAAQKAREIASAIRANAEA